MAYLALALMWITVSIPISIGIYLTHNPWFLCGFIFVCGFQIMNKDKD